MVGYSSLPSIKHISFFSILSSLSHCSSLPSSLSTHPLFFEIAGMDSNPYIKHTSNFVDLLNSQQDIVFGLG